MKKQICIIENGFIVFRSILHDDRYTFACVWTNPNSIFATVKFVSQKHGFWTLQQLLQAMKIVDHAVFSSRMGIKKNYWVPSQDYTADDPLIRCFYRLNIQLFASMCESSHYRDGEWFVVSGLFFLLLQRLSINKWLCTIQNWPFYDPPKAQLRHGQFSKKKAIICFEVLLARTIFVGFSSLWNTQTVDCCFVSRSYA